MIKQGINKVFRHLGYEVKKINKASEIYGTAPENPLEINPVWPLPRCKNGPSDEEIRTEFAKYDLWHYAYEFEGGLKFSSHHNQPGKDADRPERPLQRFKHFMPYLVNAAGGSLKGKRILDIACNSGFWSIQCGLLGAEVVGFDGRSELVAQANLIKSIVGLENVTFQQLDFWKMTPEALGGKFDYVLNLGILYHLPSPIEAIELTKSMAKDLILLDTGISDSGDSIIKLIWEEAFDIRQATSDGVVAFPSKSGIDIIFKHTGMSQWFEIPMRTQDMPPVYLNNRRASWLVKV